MEKRCQKFFDDAKKLKVQEVNSLKKFLYKNQDYKFMENDKSKLYGAIEVYFFSFNVQFYKSSLKENPQLVDAVFSLMEDALAMPQNVFTNS